MRTAGGVSGPVLPDAPTVLEIAESAAVLAEQAVSQAKRRSPAPPLACKEGCDWCCYLKVGTAAPEVFRIVAYLRQTLPPDDFEALCERVRVADDERRALRSGGRRTEGRPC